MSFVASLFGMKPQKAPRQDYKMPFISAPSMDNSQKEVEEAADNLRQQEKMRTGRLSTLVTGGQGVEESGVTTKTLLGS